MNSATQSPCRFCTDRKIGCHGHCEVYQEYAKVRREICSKRISEAMKPAISRRFR